MTRFTVLPVLLLAITALPLQAADDVVYKWVDDDGFTQYTASPPSGRDYVTITKTRSGGSATSSQRARDYNSGYAERREARKQDAIKKSEAADRGNMMKAKCDELRKGLETMNTRPRIFVPDGEGGHRVLDQDEKAERVKDFKAKIKEHCS